MTELRPFWQNKIEAAWKKAPIVWLAGVRRVGKTTLAKTLSDTTYLNCDLPSIQAELKDPESLLKRVKSKIVVFDEIHQAEEASQVLKIAADEFPGLKVLATGSSTLVAGKKFRDTLTGRKRNVFLQPVMLGELAVFQADLKKRIERGGLPTALLSAEYDQEFYAEWMDSFFARDIQEMFFVEKRQHFLKTLEYLLIHNGGMLDVSKMAQVCGVTRPTIVKYLEILEVTRAITLVRPYAKNPEQEIVSQAKVYGFDTGFCAYAQGVESFGAHEYGGFLENLVLETLLSFQLQEGVRYWRTKTKKEIDFVLTRKGTRGLTAIECKWQERQFDASGFESFRRLYPIGMNWVVTSNSKSRTEKTKWGEIEFINIHDFEGHLSRL